MQLDCGKDKTNGPEVLYTCIWIYVHILYIWMYSTKSLRTQNINTTQTTSTNLCSWASVKLFKEVYKTWNFLQI